MKTLAECLAERPVSTEVYELWNAAGLCFARRFKDELKPELTKGLKVGDQREFGDHGTYVMRVA